MNKAVLKTKRKRAEGTAHDFPEPTQNSKKRAASTMSQFSGIARCGMRPACLRQTCNNHFFLIKGKPVLLLCVSVGQAGFFFLLPECKGTVRVVVGCTVVSILFFKKYPYSVSQAGLQHLSSSTLPPQVLASQVCTTTLGSRMLTLNKATCSAWVHGRVCSPKIRRVSLPSN